MLSTINSSIRYKLLLAVLSACVLVAIALGVALNSLSSISTSFSRFIEEDQAKLEAFMAMYAQGLQGGQALRNIVLNPSDKKAVSNLEKSYKDFDDAFQIASKISLSDPVWKAMLADIAQKWRVTLDARQRVLNLAATNQADTIKLLNDDETPAWRLTRELLTSTVAELKKAS